MREQDPPQLTPHNGPEALGSIQSSLNALAPAESNVRVTPPAGVGTFRVDCSVVNISIHTRKVSILVVGLDGASVITSVTLEPGRGTSAGHNFGPAPIGGYCKFAVFDGDDNPAARNDVRGVLTASDLLGRLIALPAE